MIIRKRLPGRVKKGESLQLSGWKCSCMRWILWEDLANVRMDTTEQQVHFSHGAKYPIDKIVCFLKAGTAQEQTKVYS